MDQVRAQGADEAHELEELARPRSFGCDRVERCPGLDQRRTEVTAIAEKGDVEVEAEVAVGGCHVDQRCLGASTGEAVDHVEDPHLLLHVLTSDGR